MVALTHQFKVGNFSCTVIGDSDERFPVDAVVGMFPTIPAHEVEYEARRYEVEPGLIGFAINILLIDTGEHHILVDTSVGGSDSPLLDILDELGVQPELIDRVIITHGHDDHIGGIIGVSGTPNFPNARYSMWKREWEYWIEQAEKSDDPQSAPRHNLLPIRNRVDVIDEESEILPGICVLPAPGHTLGHIALLLESNGERLLHIVDCAHNPAQIAHTDWSPLYDIQPELSAQTRKTLFERAARENLLVLAYHFPFPGIGRVSEQNGILEWKVQ